MSNHEVCLKFKKEITLGLVARDSMAVGSWMGDSYIKSKGEA